MALSLSMEPCMGHRGEGGAGAAPVRREPEHYASGAGCLCGLGQLHRILCPEGRDTSVDRERARGGGTGQLVELLPLRHRQAVLLALPATVHAWIQQAEALCSELQAQAVPVYTGCAQCSRACMVGWTRLTVLPQMSRPGAPAAT